MSNLGIHINGREYRIACDDGQEMHLKRIASELDNRVRGLAKAMGPTTPDSLLLAISAIMLTDELMDSHKENDRLKTLVEQSPKMSHREYQAQFDATLSDTINAIADRIERIAETLQ